MRIGAVILFICFNCFLGIKAEESSNATTSYNATIVDHDDGDNTTMIQSEENHNETNAIVQEIAESISNSSSLSSNDQSGSMSMSDKGSSMSRNDNSLSMNDNSSSMSMNDSNSTLKNDNGGSLSLNDSSLSMNDGSLRNDNLSMIANSSNLSLQDNSSSLSLSETSMSMKNGLNASETEKQGNTTHPELEVRLSDPQVVNATKNAEGVKKRKRRNLWAVLHSVKLGFNPFNVLNYFIHD